MDSSERTLTKSGTPIQLTPKAFDVLLLLVKDRGQLISKARLMDIIWPATFVEEKTLTQNIFTLRKVLGTAPDGQSYIETIPKHGYRLRAEVEAIGRHEFMSAGQEQHERAVLEEIKAEDFDREVREGASADRAGADSLTATPAPPVIKVPATREAGNQTQTNRRLPLTKTLVISVATVVVLIIGALLTMRFVGRGRSNLADGAFRNISVTRLTRSGDVSALDLSPDGKYVAYASRRGDMQSLLLRQVEATSTVEIVPPAPVSYRGITFSPDGAWVYYVTVGKETYAGTLYRVPVLGGTPQKVSQTSVDSRVGFSPDGKRIAFVHWTDRATTTLVIAGAAGTAERQVASRSYADGFSLAGPAWSPDGKTILIPTQSYDAAQHQSSIIAIDVEDGNTRTVPSGRWNWIGQLSWLADGSGVVLTAWDSDSEVMSDQIWLMTYPTGEVRRLTSDVNGYLGVNVSANAQVIAASLSTPALNFWVAPGGDWANARKITNGSGDLYSARLGLGWTPDGRVVFSTRQGGNPDIWIMEADGTRQKQLTFDPGADLQPAASPDGRYIAFVSTRTGKRQLWRMDMDGSNPLQLSGVEGVNSLTFTPDGQWIVYSGYGRTGRPSVWRSPVAGGDAVQLTEEMLLHPAVSPDGQSIAGLLPNESFSQAKLLLISFTDGRRLKQFDAPVLIDTPNLRWSPDGRAITYVLTQQGAANIWSQPLDGRAPKALTDWKDDLIYRFDWARDGSLLCERGNVMSDVILLRSPSNR